MSFVTETEFKKTTSKDKTTRNCLVILLKIVRIVTFYKTDKRHDRISRMKVMIGLIGYDYWTSYSLNAPRIFKFLIKYGHQELN